MKPQPFSPVALATLALAALAVAVAAPMASHGRRAAPAAGRIAAPRSAKPSPPPTRSEVVVMGPGENLAHALRRGGLPEGEAARAAGALAEDFDIVNPHPGLPLALTLSAAPGLAGPRLTRLAFSPGDERAVALTWGAGGAPRIWDAQRQVFSAPSRVAGVVDGSLFLSLAEAGVDATLAAKVVGLFGRSLDLGREVRSGDRFTLLFEQPVSADAAPVAGRTLLLAELDGRAGRTRLYRFQPRAGGPADYVEGDAGPIHTLLLRTPVEGARVTSAFGPRLHPILGFTRLHQGVDFGAPVGAPVLAAGDGVVEAARWSGGYGRWLKIRHADGMETAYAHLSAWAAGMAPGTPVRQGQVVAFVGETGLATGPHLHYEVFSAGRRIDPRLAKSALVAGGSLGGDAVQRAAFRAQKARIDGLIQGAGREG